MSINLCKDRLKDIDIFNRCIIVIPTLHKKPGYGILENKRSYIVINLRIQSNEILKLRRATFW